MTIIPPKTDQSAISRSPLWPGWLTDQEADAIIAALPAVITNLDGISVTLTTELHRGLRYWVIQGYTEMILLRGIVGSSELGMTMRITEHYGIAAWVKPRTDIYAAVLLHDGTFTSGSFHLFRDNSFSLS